MSCNSSSKPDIALWVKFNLGTDEVVYLTVDPEEGTLKDIEHRLYRRYFGPVNSKTFKTTVAGREIKVMPSPENKVDSKGDLHFVGISLKDGEKIPLTLQRWCRQVSKFLEERM